MKNIWDKTIPIDQEMARHLIEKVCSLPVHEIILLGEGFDNSAFLINNTLVFRFPHREAGVICMENEISLLPYLAQNVSFSLPLLSKIGSPTAQYPFPFAGYRMLSGAMLSHYQEPLIENHDFAKILGLWLKELHTVPILHAHEKIIKGEHAWRLDVAQRTDRVRYTVSHYRTFFIQAGFQPDALLNFMYTFNDLDMHSTKRSYVHGDLYAKHIIVNERGMPEGLIDWGDIHIGNPALDLAVGVMLFNQDTYAVFLKAYGMADTVMLRTALFKAFYHAILSLPYFYQNDERSLNWAKAALNSVFASLRRGNN